MNALCINSAISEQISVAKTSIIESSNLMQIAINHIVTQ